MWKGGVNAECGTRISQNRAFEFAFDSDSVGAARGVKIVRMNNEVWIFVGRLTSCKKCKMV